MSKFKVDVEVVVDVPPMEDKDGEEQHDLGEEAERLVEGLLNEGRMRVLGLFNASGMSISTSIKHIEVYIPELEDMKEEDIYKILDGFGFPNNPIVKQNGLIKAGHRIDTIIQAYYEPILRELGLSDYIFMVPPHSGRDSKVPCVIMNTQSGKIITSLDDLPSTYDGMAKTIFNVVVEELKKRGDSTCDKTEDTVQSD